MASSGIAHWACIPMNFQKIPYILCITTHFCRFYSMIFIDCPHILPPFLMEVS